MRNVRDKVSVVFGVTDKTIFHRLEAFADEILEEKQNRVVRLIVFLIVLMFFSYAN